jgi:hypothetical protein
MARPGLWKITWKKLTTFFRPVKTQKKQAVDLRAALSDEAPLHQEMKGWGTFFD